MCNDGSLSTAISSLDLEGLVSVWIILHLWWMDVYLFSNICPLTLSTEFPVGYDPWDMIPRGIKQLGSYSPSVLKVLSPPAVFQRGFLVPGAQLGPLSHDGTGVAAGWKTEVQGTVYEMDRSVLSGVIEPAGLLCTERKRCTCTGWLGVGRCWQRAESTFRDKYPFHGSSVDSAVLNVLFSYCTCNGGTAHLHLHANAAR